jgi:hypothetical protein
MSSISDIVNAQVSRNEMTGMSSLVTITEKLVERMNKQQASHAIDFENNGDYRRGKRQIGKLQSFKDQISGSVTAASKAQSALGFIEQHMDTMRTKLQSTLGSTSQEDRENTATEFGKLWDKINRDADGANHIMNYQNINLIGNTEGPDWKTEDIYTRTSQKGGYTTIQGAYLGSNFELIDTEGYSWQIAKNDEVYKQYNDTGSATGKEISTKDLTINSFDASTDALTLSNGMEALSGTLNRGGLKILQSQYYNNFTDDKSIQNAINDIDKAIIHFDTKAARIRGNTTLLQGNNDLIKEQIAQLEKEVADIVTVEVNENSAKRRAEGLKFAMTLNNMNLISQNNQGLIQNMLQAAQGPGAASGIFGLMGY